MTDDVELHRIADGSWFWQLVRVALAAGLVAGVVVSLLDRDVRIIGLVGGLTGLILLELRFVREGRSPILNAWRRRTG